MILRRICERPHHPYLPAGLHAVLRLHVELGWPPNLLRVCSRSIVDINPGRPNAGGANELNLFLFAVMKRRRTFQRVEVVFVERLLRDGRLTAAPTTGAPNVPASPRGPLKLINVSCH